MPYHVTVDTSLQCAILTHHGELSADDIRRSGIELIERAGRGEFTRILVDVSAIKNRLGTTQLFLSTEEVSQLGPPKPRVALLGRGDQADDLRFVEDVGVNRGIPLKVFIDKAAALKWLQNP